MIGEAEEPGQEVRQPGGQAVRQSTNHQGRNGATDSQAVRPQNCQGSKAATGRLRAGQSQAAGRALRSGWPGRAQQLEGRWVARGALTRWCRLWVLAYSTCVGGCRSFARGQAGQACQGRAGRPEMA